MLVEKDKNLDLKHALRIAADVQPIEVEERTLTDVRPLTFDCVKIEWLCIFPLLCRYAMTAFSS